MSTGFSAEALYPKLPVFLQNAACAYYGWREARVRFGPLFDRKLAELMQSERWSESEIEAYQSEKLQELVRHAYENVPYYRQVMKQRNLVPKDIRRREDLPKLPILTKEDVRCNLDRLISEKARKRDLILRHTSGTTGTSLCFYSSRSGIAFQWAVWERHRRRFGVASNAWHVNFTGKRVVPAEQNRPPYWRWNPAMHQALINMQQVNVNKIGPIVSFLNDHSFDFYAGYPSIIHALALAAREKGLGLTTPPRVIVTGAENVLAPQRRDITAFTGAVMTDQYGASEGCGNASHCPAFVYHEDFEFGILECEDPAPGGDGRWRGGILCTGFANPEFPFIRYRIGDTALWENPASICPCGRRSCALLAIEGRLDDYVITPEGNRIMRFDYLFKDTQNIRECQVVQDKLGEITIRVVRRPEYSAKDETLVVDEVHRWISPRLGVVFDYVSEIPRETNGKFRAVKSLLPKQSAV